MPYVVSIDEARAGYPQFEFIGTLTPSAQKCAFHVRDRENGCDLCLKLIAPDYGRDRLDREILALQAIAHPNVVRLKEYVFSSKVGEQKHYIVEEFIEGTDLSARLKPGETWELNDASEFFEALCDGLSALAAENIVHRDLKPSNIRVRPNGSPVIIDFGLARHLRLPDITPTNFGARIGTPRYFAPEQFTGTKYDIDCRTDLFAVGLMMHEVLLGRHPFWYPRIPPQAFCDAVCLSEEFRDAPDFQILPQPWKLLVSRLLSKQRGNRPASATQVATILRKNREAQ